MNQYSNNSNIKISGNGNYIGGNVIDNRREYHNHHNKPPRKSDDTKGEIAAIIFTALTVIWFYSKHAYEIYEYIRIGAFASTLSFIVVLAIGLLWKPEEIKHLYMAGYGLLIALVTVFLAQYGINNLDPQLVEIGKQSQNAWAFWSHLSSYGRQLVIGSLAGAVLTSATIIISLFMGAHILWCEIADSYFDYGYIPSFLNPFRPSVAGVIVAFFLLFGWLFTSGCIFELLE